MTACARQRLDQPYLRDGGKLRPASWAEAFAAIASKVKLTSPQRIGAIAGDLATVEEMFALKELLTGLRVKNLDCRQDGTRLDPAWGRASYIFNATIAGIEKSDALLIVGSNPRKEAAVLNARIRKRWRAGNYPVGVIGDRAALTYDYDYLGAGVETLADLAAGRHAFAETLKKAERPLIILGQGALARPDAPAIVSLAAKAAVDLGAIKDGWNGFSVLHTAASRVGGLDIGFVPGEGGLHAGEMATFGTLDVAFLLGADEIDIASGRFRRLHRHSWRSWRASRRCHSAGRGLHRKVRPLRQHRRPRADGQSRGVSAGRCTRRLGDPARAVGASRLHAAL